MVEIIVTENGNVRGVFTRVISASLTDSLNGECTFQFSVISSAAKEIFTGLEVELKSDTLNYIFNVVKVSKSLSNGIAICTVECEHKSYELNNDEYKLTEFDFEGAPGECLIPLLQGASLTAGICDPTVKFVISAAGTLAFILKKNENEVMRYEEYFSEGQHTKTYTYPFTSEVGQNTMSLSVVSADGAEGKFPKMQTWGYVMGAYLAGDTPWDGYIEAREGEVHFTIRRIVRKSLVRTSDTLWYVGIEILVGM